MAALQIAMSLFFIFNMWFNARVACFGVKVLSHHLQFQPGLVGVTIIGSIYVHSKIDVKGGNPTPSSSAPSVSLVDTAVNVDKLDA